MAKLTAYQAFVKKNYDKYGGDFKKLGAAWQKKKGGTSTPKPKAKPRSVSTTSRKKPVEKKPRKTSAQKAKTQAVPVSALEKRTTGLFQKLEQIRLALAVPKSDFKLKQTSKGWSLKVKGWKQIKKSKLSDLVASATKKARSRV